MIDINQYTYTKEPFDVHDKFNIHPLNEIGINQYYQKDAHTHTYLDKINPRKMETIYKERNELDQYMKTVLQERESKRQIKLGLSNRDVNTNNERNENQNQEGNMNDYDQQNHEENIYNQNNNEENYNNNIVEIEENQENNRYDNNMNNKPKHNRSQTSDNFYNQNRSNNFSTNQQDNRLNQNNVNGYSRYALNQKQYYAPQKLDEKLACFGNTNFGKRVQPKLQNLTFKLNQKPQNRYSMKESDTYPNVPGFYIRPAKKVGFESYNVPRINKSVNKKPLQVSNFDNKCFKSLSGFFNSNDKNFRSYLNKENDRLTGILLNQTSDNFLKSNKLPKISYIVNQPELIIKKTGIGNSKFMGVGYNPDNYNPTNSKNLTKRNISGALFLH